MVEGSL
jgi:WD40 repeat protein